ncbi:MAG: thiamine pyrophosphate-binding protein [Nitrososphaerota archaeon]|nr:thiamine pyrophosphate-binding protein [Nitrososphaerota archaeon]MDG7019267.1 thiamine pyrophosphate-binding protein [Nitrososphaerota archaeon]MDG7027552.1 thiamine pyrophosphate-binding protein [Nitrososphaerota archaeon]
MKVSELLVASLEGYGVRRAYGLVGTSVLDLMDALSGSGIRYVSTRHEQVAVSMADAEGRVTGRPGVALVHGGPGFLNSLVGLANAWKDGSPMLLVAGAVKRRMSGMDSWLEIPQTDMARSLVKGSWRIEKGMGAGKAIADAFSLAASAPAGPVYLEVPDDVWSQEAGRQVVQASAVEEKQAREEEVKLAAGALAKAERPLLVVGGGINSPRGSEALADLLSKTKIPSVSTGNGRGAVPEDSPMSLGRIGFGGVRVADAALAQADMVLCLGCGLSDVSTFGFNTAPRGEVYAVNMDPLWDKKPIPYAMHSDADASEFAKRLAAVVEASAKDGWRSRIEGEREGWRVILSEAERRHKPGYANPAGFLSALDRALPRDAILAAGQGLHQVYAYACLKVRSSRSFLAATNMGSMGFVFPAVLGAKMALPEREVVGVMGDGEFMMTLHDMETAVRERIGAKVVVVNDNSYRVLLMRQKIQKMGRVYGTTHANPDFAKVADAFGAKGMVVDSDDRTRDAVDFIMEKSDVPLVLELRVDPEDLPPVNIQGSLMF